MKTTIVTRDQFEKLKDAQARASDSMGIDHSPSDDKEVAYWHGDDRDFIDVAWDLKHAGILDTAYFEPDDIDPDAALGESVDVCHVVSTAFRHSTAVRHLIALEAARLILDTDRLASVMEGIPQAVKNAKAKQAANPLSNGGGSYLLAQVATAIREQPQSENYYENLSAMLGEDES